MHCPADGWMADLRRASGSGYRPVSSAILSLASLEHVWPPFRGRPLRCSYSYPHVATCSAVFPGKPQLTNRLSSYYLHLRASGEVLRKGRHRARSRGPPCASRRTTGPLLRRLRPPGLKGSNHGAVPRRPDSNGPRFAGRIAPSGQTSRLPPTHSGTAGAVVTDPDRPLDRGGSHADAGKGAKTLLSPPPAGTISPNGSDAPNSGAESSARLPSYATLHLLTKQDGA